MVRYKLTFIVVLLLCLFLVQCNTPTGGGGAVPQPPDWLDVKLSFDKLPSENEPAKLTFDIIVTGEDSVLYVVHTGDTLDFLYMKFSTSDWIVGLNADADTLWDGKVNIGQRIILEPVFQIDSALIPIDTMDITPVYSPYGDNHRHFWNYIDLQAVFLTSKNDLITDKDSLFESYGCLGYRLYFDYRTGDYHFGN